MDIVAIKTTEEFLKTSKDNTALIYLTSGQKYETRSIYHIIEPNISAFQPLVVVDVNLQEDDLAIIPVVNIHHIVIKGPEKEKKIGFFIESRK